MLTFEENSHVYKDETNHWTSATKLISQYKQPFDADTIAQKVSKNKKSKWYNLDPEYIKELWNKESDRANSLGTLYHNARENELLACSEVERHGKRLNVIPCRFTEDGAKVAGDQKLTDGIYPEHLVYLNSHKIAGQSDLVEVIDGKVYITDYKTNKEIKMRSFKSWDGGYQKMLPPLGHLEDCNFNHYTLQLSLYMYMILKHNPKLKFGGLIIQHVTFKKLGDDEYGFPIYEFEKDGSPVVENVVLYELKYLKKEIQTILKYYGKTI